MLIIEIDQDLKGKVPETELLCIECDVVMQEPPTALLELIEAQAVKTRASLAIEEISQMPSIRASRSAYKASGKDPARYRLSAEALLRRIVKGEELYKISNVVDLLNLVSFTTGFSIGGYDAAKIKGPVRFGIGREGEPYTGIGRGALNIEGLPVFRDDRGAFGSPTSDSERTCVDWNTQRFLMVIINFGTNGLLADAGEMATRLLLEFAGAKNMDIQTIK